MAGGLVALSVGRQSLACILGAEEAGELPLLRLSPPRCVRSLHCVSRGWKASSHLLPGPLPLLAIPDTGSGGKEAGKRRAARTPAGPAALQPRPALRSLLSRSRRLFTLESGTSARPGRDGKGRAGAALQAPPGFPGGTGAAKPPAIKETVAQGIRTLLLCCCRFCCTKQDLKRQHLFQILYSHVMRRKEGVSVAFRD